MSLSISLDVLDLGDVFVDFITNRSARNQNNSEITWQTKLGILSSGTILSRHSQNENLTKLAPTAIGPSMFFFQILSKFYPNFIQILPDLMIIRIKFE